MIPELKEKDANTSYRVPANCVTWALEYAYNLGQQHPNIGPEQAARMVVQSMAGRNMIRVVESHWGGLTEHVDSVTPLKTTQSDYEGDGQKATWPVKSFSILHEGR